MTFFSFARSILKRAVRLVPFHAILMSVILEQQKQLARLTCEITSLAGERVGGTLA